MLKNMKKKNNHNRMQLNRGCLSTKIRTCSVKVLSSQDLEEPVKRTKPHRWWKLLQNSMKASWTTFGDDDDESPVQPPAKKIPPKRPPGPARPPPPKLSSRRSMDAVAMEENDPFSTPPQNRRTSAPNAGNSL